jgi:hypothetical protein
VNHRHSRASSGILSDYTFYEEDTEQREESGDGNPIPEFPAAVGGSSTDLPRPKWPRRISSLCDLPRPPLPTAAGRPTTSHHPPHQWPRRTSSLYPTQTPLRPGWSSWFDDNVGEIEVLRPPLLSATCSGHRTNFRRLRPWHLQ